MDWLRCAEASLRAGEPLAGTAAEATHWLALEERGAWAPKPLKTPSLGPLAEPLSRWDAAHPGLRLQLIRRPRRREDGRRVLLGDVGAGTVFGATVDDRGLAELDVDRWLATGEPPAGFAAVERPVHLVCTHGKRDECCAVRGVALYKGLVAAVRELPRSRRPELWQTSHLGGHRFAATMVTLPHGYCLGRVEPSEAQAILAAEGLHDLGRVRGRSLWPKPVQSADVAFRETLGPRGLEPTGVRLIEARESDGEWIVRLEAVTMGAPPSTHELRVTQTMSTTTFPKSCGDEPVLVPLLRARRPQ